MTAGRSQLIEWPTAMVACCCYGLLMAAVGPLAEFSVPVAVTFTALLAALHSSLQHEVIHGHPFRSRFWSVALVFPPVGLFIPFERFRDTHLKHHHDPNLTDPYEDPETNYLDPEVWTRLSRPLQLLLRINNTLLGRMALGPAISQFVFMRDDARRVLAGDVMIMRAWLLHVVGAVPVLYWVAEFGSMSLPAYVLAAYGGLSILKVRTFLEHRAHERPRGRTVVVDDRGPLALLFLNNNFHLVHHMHPGEAWYKLPAMFDGDRTRYLGRNEGYVYRNYLEVFARHLLVPKDPVPHPLWRRSREGGPGSRPSPAPSGGDTISPV